MRDYVLEVTPWLSSGTSRETAAMAALIYVGCRGPDRARQVELVKKLSLSISIYGEPNIVFRRRLTIAAGGRSAQPQPASPLQAPLRSLRWSRLPLDGEDLDQDECTAR